jgi:hypothetical protein
MSEERSGKVLPRKINDFGIFFLLVEIFSFTLKKRYFKDIANIHAYAGTEFWRAVSHNVYYTICGSSPFQVSFEIFYMAPI